MSNCDVTIDVRQYPPGNRKPMIFEKFDSLKPGEKMELINDHDPSMLHEKLKAERGGQFAWDYIEQGPAVWRICISKR